jgi:mannose-6-phosphate isomerase-like protein (cupin superfamily)
MEGPIAAVSLDEKLETIREYWSPGIIGALNGQHVKLAKFKGEFCWHEHADQDEMFLVLKGSIRIRLLDADLHLREGQMAIIPRGTLHMPMAAEEACVLLLEPEGTVNTGGERNPLTRQPGWI